MADTSNCGCTGAAPVDPDAIRGCAARVHSISAILGMARDLTDALEAACPGSCSHKSEVTLIAEDLRSNWDSFARLARECRCVEANPALREPVSDLRIENGSVIRGILDRTCPETCERRAKVSKIVSAMIAVNVRFSELTHKCRCRRAEDLADGCRVPPAE